MTGTRNVSRVSVRVIVASVALILTSVGLASPALAALDDVLPVLQLFLGFPLERDKQEFVSVPDDPRLDFGPTDEMALSVWVKLSEQAETYHILSKRDVPCGEMNYQIARDLGGLHFNSGSGEGSSRVDTTMNDLPLGVWTHIVVAYANSTLKIYVNSNLVGGASPYELQPVKDAPLMIGGAADCGDTFPGTIRSTKHLSAGRRSAERGLRRRASRARRRRPRVRPTRDAQSLSKPAALTCARFGELGKRKGG